MSKRRGFTLVELMVVIAIIGLLVGMLVPALGKARAMGRRTACAANLKQIGVLMRTYLGNRGDRFPYASFMPSVSSFPAQTEESIFIADVLLKGYGGSGDVFQCPADQLGALRPSPNAGKSYFESEKSSYEYRVRLGGQMIDRYANRIEQFTERVVPEDAIWIMRDYENFHGTGGSAGARRYLYNDGSVSDFKN